MAAAVIPVRDAQRCGVDQSRISELARPTAGTGRPFFAFLNYLDAHSPYEVPSNANHRFGTRPQTPLEQQIIYGQWTAIDKLGLPRDYWTLARNCYDSCLAYLDEEIGRLCDELERRGVLGETWVVITSDHGEGLGEHDLFEHGESLYSTEIRVPLLIVPPSRIKAQGVVPETVSLRDLPATVVELTGPGNKSPFPGRSLSTLWGTSKAATRRNRGRNTFRASEPESERSKSWPIAGPPRTARLPGRR